MSLAMEGPLVPPDSLVGYPREPNTSEHVVTLHLVGGGAFLALNALASFGHIVPPNVAQYSSPPPRLKFASAWMPGLGGTTVIGPFLPKILTLIKKVPDPVLLIEATLTGPWIPQGSLYLKPIALIADQPLAGMS